MLYEPNDSINDPISSFSTSKTKHVVGVSTVTSLDTHSSSNQCKTSQCHAYRHWVVNDGAKSMVSKNTYQLEQGVLL